MTRINLNGTWESILPDGRSLQVQVPGCWDTYVKEKDIGEAVRYRKEITVNKEDGKTYMLSFGGVSYYCDVFVNGRTADSHEGMWDGFRLDITPFVNEGINTIELDITKPGYKKDDRFPVRQVLSGFIPDVLCTFGGIWDDVCIEVHEDFYIKSSYAAGSMDGTLAVNMTLESLHGCNGSIHVTAEILSPAGEKVLALQKEIPVKDAAEYQCLLEDKIEDPMLWDMENPNLYTCRITASDGSIVRMEEKCFGFRDIRAEGTRILLNGKPVYPRGILHWGYYDDEIIPNPSQEVIQNEIDKVKAYGFNMIKHCLYIPRREYFELADKNGILLWVELPLWIPEVTGELVGRIEREYPLLLEQIAGHPSIVLLSLGCELDDKIDSNLLEELYQLAKVKSSALVRDNSGSGECYDGLPVDYADFSDYHFYGDINIMEHLMETFTPSWRNNRPWVFGEFCDSDTMRDLQVIRDDKGVETLLWEQKDASKNPVSSLKGDFRAHLHDQRMVHYGIRQDFDRIYPLTVNHAMVHRKMTLEMTRSFREICGYNITSIRDVPIATSGMFDDLMRPKFPTEDVRQFNSDIVLSPAWDLTRIWINADRVLYKERFSFFSGAYYGLHVILSNYSDSVLESPGMKWQLLSDGEVVAEQSMTTDQSFQPGEVKELGYVSMTLPEVKTPQTYILHVEMIAADRTVVNQWPVFVYPSLEKSGKVIGLYDPANVFVGLDQLYETVELEDGQEVQGADLVVTSRLTPEIREYASKGGRVFYVQRGKGWLPSTKVAFWREGTIRYDSHPILEGIEYETWMDDLRFYSLSTDTALDTFEFEKAGITADQVTPIVRRYDCREWIATDYMAEIRMGNGTILATTLRFEGGLGKQPMFLKYNTFGRWLFQSALEYLTAEDGKEKCRCDLIQLSEIRRFPL